MSLLGRIAKRQWAGSVGILLWVWLLYSGVSIYRGAASQGITGLPNQGHRTLYIWTPAVMTVITLLLVVVAKKIPLWLFVVIFFVLMAALLPVGMLFGGGV